MWIRSTSERLPSGCLVVAYLLAWPRLRRVEAGSYLPAPPLRTVLESFPSFRLKPFTTGAPGVGTRRQSGHETNNRERIAGSDAAVSERARQSTGAARSIWCIAGRRAGPAL